MIDLYGESQAVSTSDPISNPVLEIDMNEVNLTLFQLIHRTKKIIDSIPEDAGITIYFVSGFKNHNTYEFWNEYFNYLNSIPNPGRLLLIFRGYIHLQNLGFFFLNVPVMLSRDCKIIYSSANLHEILNLLSANREIYNNFSSRFFDFYRKFTYFVSEDTNELSILGFTFQTF
jgi:hypothetical protein